ncbi:acyl-protein synthetase [Emticicia oligotrophica DSM 17448]|uniref:Acyl-protein synthetase n=1 Tax=Emticicia oligotrophica (strain DSM 17448 / CIP 109782 / MTCC 6937 / GPTSA100-15) TaxID=929562 RepID=A0ABM5MZZ5_EMTOG|nr:acyltransferase [Emticicia oligotrophica]AFK02758.1 acyl-protein synthetase [Emticicia oligotrophica DSM 17448]
MGIRDELKSAVLQLNDSSVRPHDFEELALEIFRFQAATNYTYKEYLAYLRVNPQQVSRIEKIPFLPIQFFKHHKIVSEGAPTQIIFESSGTTGDTTSKHLVSDLPFYEYISQRIFEQFYGPLNEFHILALLPSYLERNNSSLVYMVQSFIYRTYSRESGFYLKNTQELLQQLRLLSKQQSKRKVLLIGVTFALLDLAESGEDLSCMKDLKKRLIVMETGGMKGRRKELLREEVHEILTSAFGIEKIHSEYGMTELLSQGYSKGDGIFELPNTMRVLLREINDPFKIISTVNYSQKNEKTLIRGGINVIDLANIDSCCFIETQDLGAYNTENQSFSIIGRFDNSDIRGCNLMYQG